MNKNAILRTAQTTWSETDACYVTASPLAETIVGVGETPEEAFRVFLDMVQINYEEYQAGRHALYKKVGRPQKYKVSINLHVSPDVRTRIQQVAQQFGITQGEAVEYWFKKFPLESI